MGASTSADEGVHGREGVYKQMVADRHMEGEVVDAHVRGCAGGGRGTGDEPVEVGRRSWGTWMRKCVVVRACRCGGTCAGECTGAGVREWGMRRSRWTRVVVRRENELGT